MNGTFYIASSGDGLSDVILLATVLENRGMRNAFRWPDHWHHKCAPAVCGLRDRRELGERELEAASSCDLFIGINRLGKGSHVEFGAALVGRARRFILIGIVPADLVFYEDARIEHASTVAEAVRMVVGTAGAG